MTGPNYQDMIRALQGYWAERGCVLWQPYHTEVGAGTLNPAFAPGTWMMLSDHLNLTGTSPLEGADFIDMTVAYDAACRADFRTAAIVSGMTLHEGVYAGLRGIEALLNLPLADVGRASLTPRAAREALAVVNASHEYHGGFRLRTLAAS